MTMLRARPGPLLAVLLLAAPGGCTDGEPAPGGVADAGAVPPGACPPGEAPLVGGGCQKAGTRAGGCAAGETEASRGRCEPAGIPESACAEGFEPDGKRGCNAILPAEPCLPGAMAVPGESECRPVAPCGDEPWAGIPAEPGTQYVDAAYAGQDSNGTPQRPWTEIGAAIAAAAPQAVVAVATGSYVEDLAIEGRAVRLWGRCPELVEIVGSGESSAAIRVGAGAAGTEIRSLAIRSASAGISIAGAGPVLLDRLWIHDVLGHGLDVLGASGESAAMLRRSLVESTRERGVYVEGAAASIEETVVRETAAPPAGGGRGVDVRDDLDGKSRGSLTLRRSVIERSHEVGVLAHASDATIEACVVRDTLPNAEGRFGRGVVAQTAAGAAGPAKLELRGSVVERSLDAGVFVAASEAAIDATVIRDTSPNADQGERGSGIAIQHSAATGAQADVRLSRSLLDRNHDLGVLVGASRATIEATVVRETLPVAGKNGRGVHAQGVPGQDLRAALTVRTSVIEQAHAAGISFEAADAVIDGTVIRDTLPQDDGRLGRGLSGQDDLVTGTRSTLELRASLVEQSYEIGVFLTGTDALVETTLVRATSPEKLSGLYGMGMAVQRTTGTGQAAKATIRHSVVEASSVAGIIVGDSEASIEGTVVRQALAADGLFGDGLVVGAYEGSSTASLSGSLLEANARAGAACFGASLAMAGTAFACNVLDLAAQEYQGRPAVLQDLGGNTCGCETSSRPCRALPAQIEPPQPAQ
ncbi:MAG: right-handed parallel beta-helix repeat-containing protein [Deltaproteobacteria bacterium]|nr:right-handed parallel beta-helix repeat-containing protein [Deltaproteobacteria bacterium]